MLAQAALSFPGPSIDERRFFSESRKEKCAIASVPCLWGRVVAKEFEIWSCWRLQTNSLLTRTRPKHFSTASPRLLPWPVPRSCIAWVHRWWNISRTRGRQLSIWPGAVQLHLSAASDGSRSHCSKSCPTLSSDRAKHAEEQAAEQRALCLAAKAALKELQHHFAFQLLEGQERVRVELRMGSCFDSKAWETLAWSL